MMDFTFDNPFDDVFTDPNPAPTQPQPVVNAQPQIQQPIVPQPVPEASQIASPQTNPVEATTEAPLHTPIPITPTPVQTDPIAQQPYAVNIQQQQPIGNNTQPLNQPQVIQQPIPQEASPLGQQTAAIVETQLPPEGVPNNPSPQPAQSPATEAINPNDQWREAKAPNGRIYYYKKSTRETTWAKPPTYIPLGGAALVSGNSGASPQASPAQPTNTPLTGFPIASPLQTTASPAPQGTSDNPALGNPALGIQSHPSDNPALISQVSQNNLGLPQLNPNIGGPAAFRPAGQVGLSGSQNDLSASGQSTGSTSSPSLSHQGSLQQVNPNAQLFAQGGLNESNPSLPNVGSTEPFDALNNGMNGQQIQPGVDQANPALFQPQGMVTSASSSSLGMNGENMLPSGSNPNLAVSGGTVTPTPSSPSFPKTFRVRLPNDQRQVVPFKGDQVLRSVISKICSSRGLSMDDYIAKDKTGMDISLDRTLAEIAQDEISFLTPRAGIIPQDETKRKAHKAMSDIYEANASLSSSLAAILKNYRDPLLKSAQDVDMKKRMLSEQECNQIFASLESIASMTKDFMQQLSTQLALWPVDLTDMIQRHMEIIPFYADFVNNYRQNMNKLEELRRNPEFNAFVDGVQKSTGSKLKVEDFMSLPAIKITATAQLIDLLIGILTEQHSNYILLREFHQRLLPHANQATSLRLQMEARNKIVFIENYVLKMPKKVSLMHDQRLFFRDGIIEMTLKKKPALYYVVLFTDLLVICKAPEKKKKEKPASPPVFEEILSFGPGDTSSIDENGSQAWTINVDSPGKGKISIPCCFSTSSEHTRAEWVNSFKEAFVDFSGKPHLKPPVL